MTIKVTHFFLFYLIYASFLVTADIHFEINPEWEKPDAWSRHKVAKEKNQKQEIPEKNCEENQIIISSNNCENERQLAEINKMFYKRLAKSLFNVRKFKVISS